MSFKDLLNQPLPSTVTEGAEGCEEENIEDKVNAAAEVDADLVTDPEGEGDEDEGLGLTDEEIALLSKELEDDAIDAVINDDEDDDDDEEVTLTPEEEREADNKMALIATSMLINDELNAEEKAAFVTDEGLTAVQEGFMTETELLVLSRDLGLVEEGAYNKKMLIRLDKESRMKQLFALGVRISAQAKNDPDYIKYKKLLKMKKMYQKKLEKKYRSPAIKLMKVWWKRLTSSKSQTLKKLAKKNNVNKK